MKNDSYGAEKYTIYIQRSSYEFDKHFMKISDEGYIRKAELILAYKLGKRVMATAQEVLKICDTTFTLTKDYAIISMSINTENLTIHENNR